MSTSASPPRRVSRKALPRIDSALASRSASPRESAKHAPLPSCVPVLQVRAGKPQVMGNAGQISAIRKIPQSGPVEVTTVGLINDSQVFRLHGGVDKALHQYAADHYADWKQEKPDKAHLFEQGGFGENLVTFGMNEGNVCLGDRYRIGHEVVVEVSEPRLPCATLNRRFEWRRASIRSQLTGRSGWYLRVIKTGFIAAGNTMQLLERPHPTWSITACQAALYADNADRSLLLELADIPALGAQIRDMALNKAQTGSGEDMFSRLHDVTSIFYPCRVTAIQRVTSRVKQITFSVVDAQAGPTLNLPRFAYVRLKFGPTEIERSYSIVSGDWMSFTLGVALDRSSTGGSRYLHENLKVGDMVQMAKGQARPAQKPRKENLQRRRIFIVGGIGITAFLSEIEQLEAVGANYEIHYATPSRHEAAFAERLPALRTTYYAKDEHRRLDIEKLIPAYSDDDAGPDIFCCGPTSLMVACETRTTALGYPEDSIHMESFGLPPVEENSAFEVMIEGLIDKPMHVQPVETLLDVLNRAGLDVPSSCKVGNCGLCAVEYVRGEIQHRGVALTNREKCSSMLSCVSRAKGQLRLRNDF